MFSAFGSFGSQCALAFASLALATPLALAQTSPGSTSPTTLKVNARLVVLDVVVTDAQGRPVDDLTAKDFQVFEDNIRQPLRSLEPPSAHALPAASLATGAAQIFDPARPSSFGLSPTVVLLLDEANTHFADSSFARRQVHNYLAAQPALLPQPTNLLSVYDQHFKQLHEFTRDRDALLQALATAPTHNAWQLETFGSTEDGPLLRLDQSLRALEQIAQSYARIPGRKNLIWVGAGFPTLDPTMLDGNEDLEVKRTLRHVTDVLLDTRVTLYAIDPSSSAAGLTEITSPEQLSFAAAAGDAMTAGTDPFNADQEFNRLGLLTGGRVIRGRNDLSRQIADSISLGANFYTLTYTPTSTSNAATKFRRIRIVCLRAGLTATTRSGYFPNAGQPESSPQTAAYDLSVAAESAIPPNALRVSVEPGAAEGTHTLSLQVRVAASDLIWEAASDGESTASVYVLVAGLDAKQRMISHTTEAMKATAKPGTDLRDPSHFADFIAAATLPPKAVSLRIIVRDSNSGKMGSADLAADKLR